jgi:hypothetical protein
LPEDSLRALSVKLLEDLKELFEQLAPTEQPRALGGGGCG